MAVKINRVPGSQETSWTGISGDIRPLSGIRDGERFEFVDTGEKYIFHDGMWEPDRVAFALLNLNVL
ncbi:hypothetical protein H8E88_19225 [candidate division KSB1 bacterium]|nr:hypothetical protein [candidate division KSB1 bacterium]